MMSDDEKKFLMIRYIDDYLEKKNHRLGDITNSLESIFESIEKRSDSLERSFYDYWNLAEILHVAKTEEEKNIADKQWGEVYKNLECLRSCLKVELSRANH